MSDSVDPSSLTFTLKTESPIHQEDCGMLISVFDRAPDEILRHILHAAWSNNDEEPPKSESPHWKPNETSWARAMLLCRRFRDIAVADSALWSVINIDHACEEWVTVCVKRARDRPLDIRGTVKNISFDALIRVSKLVYWSRRVRLVLQRPEEVEIAKFQLLIELSVCARPAGPTVVDLECLELFHFNSKMFFVSSKFLDGKTSHLTHLRLEYAIIQPESLPYFPALRELNLKSPYIDQQCQNLRSLLLQTPNLMSLVIRIPVVMGPREGEDVLTASSLYSITQNKNINLPSLSTVDLTGGLRDIAIVAQTIPDPSTSFHIGAHFLLGDDSTELAEYPRILHDRAARFLRNAADKNLLGPHSLGLSMMPEDEVPGTRFHFLNLSPIASRLTTSNTPKLTLHLNSCDDFETIAKLDIINYTNALTFWDVNILQAFASPITTNSRIRQVTVMDVRMDICERSEHQAVIEEILSKRAGTGKPLHMLRLQMAVLCPLGISHDERELQESTRRRWLSAGWAKHVHMIPAFVTAVPS